jgi:hypothetical protein
MHRSAFQDLQQLEPTEIVSVMRAPRGSATPGNLLFAAALTGTGGRPKSYNVCCSYQQHSNSSGLIYAHGSERNTTKQRSCRSGLIYGLGSGRSQNQTQMRSFAKSACFPQGASCTDPSILPPIALANTAINRTNAGRLRPPAFAGYVQLQGLPLVSSSFWVKSPLGRSRSD